MADFIFDAFFSWRFAPSRSERPHTAEVNWVGVSPRCQVSGRQHGAFSAGK
jgi:hypothetical protein